MKEKIIEILKSKQSSVDNWSRDTHACFDTDYEKIALELEKLFSIPDVVQQSEQFKAIVFKMANKLALADKGIQAVQMHRIHNSL